MAPPREADAGAKSLTGSEASASASSKGGYPEARRKESGALPQRSQVPQAPHSEAGTSTSAASIPVSPDSSSDVSGEYWSGIAEAIQWDVIRLGHRIQPYRRYANCTDDIYLLSSFLELAQVNDIDGESVKLLLRVVKFLRRCDYSVEDICSVLAHASSYFVDAYELCGSSMDASEVGNVLATLIFVAHCYVQDETCPLHVWHQHLFRKYCPLSTLNSAVMRLLEIRRYVLRLESGDLSRRFSRLLQAVQKRRGFQVSAPVAGGSPENPAAPPQPQRPGPLLRSPVPVAPSTAPVPVPSSESTYAAAAVRSADGGNSDPPLASAENSLLSKLWWLEHFKYR